MRRTVGRRGRLGRSSVSTTDSIYFCQHIAIESTVRHELKAMGNTGRRIFSVVRNKQQLRFTFANQHINKTADTWRLSGSSPCSGSSRISNVGCFTSARTISARRCIPRKLERSVSRTFINAENIQPLLHQFLLAIRNGLINANRIKIARKNHITHARSC